MPSTPRMNAVTIAPFAFAKSSGTSAGDFTSFEANVATTASTPTAMASKASRTRPASCAASTARRGPVGSFGGFFSGQRQEHVLEVGTQRAQLVQLDAGAERKMARCF